MTRPPLPPPAPTPVTLTCADGVPLGGHLWPAQPPAQPSAQPLACGRVIINAATGVQSRYYHRYAAFLASHGLEVLTWDYRGIGLSRPAQLRGSGYRWRDWGQLDFTAALNLMAARPTPGPLMVVGHSIGGFLPGLGQGASRIERMLTMGAQYAWAGDYRPGHRLALLAKWHLVMPVLATLCGYFPGKRLGWLEDLPAGVAREWAFRRPRFEQSHPAAERAAVLHGMSKVQAPILAVAVSDDEFGTLPALRRSLAYYPSAARQLVELQPADYGRAQIGHFQLFHDSHRDGFWRDSLSWLLEGRNPWPQRQQALT